MANIEALEVAIKNITDTMKDLNLVGSIVLADRETGEILAGLVHDNDMQAAVLAHALNRITSDHVPMDVYLTAMVAVLEALPLAINFKNSEYPILSKQPALPSEPHVPGVSSLDMLRGRLQELLKGKQL